VPEIYRGYPASVNKLREHDQPNVEPDGGVGQENTNCCLFVFRFSEESRQGNSNLTAVMEVSDNSCSLPDVEHIAEPIEVHRDGVMQKHL